VAHPGSAGALTDPEAIAAVLRIAGENFRLLIQAALIQEISSLPSIRPEVVAMARESRVIDTQ
jgi:hypothetical protein